MDLLVYQSIVNEKLVGDTEFLNSLEFKSVYCLCSVLANRLPACRTS